MTLYLKSCPRCRGDVKTNKDMYGEYKECLQCGYMIDEPQPGLFSIPEEKKKTVKKKAA